MSRYILTLSCPDQKGILGTVSHRLFDIGGNILENAQCTEIKSDTFCMRTCFEIDGVPPDTINDALGKVAEEFSAEFSLREEKQLPKVLIMVSRYDHCLLDLFYKKRTGELAIEIPIVVSNHTDLKEHAEDNGAAFQHIPVTPQTREEAEYELLKVIKEYDIDFIVLARYMQILSENFCHQLHGRIINIHHSFLPSFRGAKPYHQAWDRGVKLIGATAHYVTPALDEGPILAQDIARVTHNDTPESMEQKGREIERRVLSRAVKAHSSGRAFLLGDRTVVFEH
ncbi:MAG: formyltetrahydrofolate deformylase [Acidimicrobiaceae bacterium]|jgi:formyltetrahydrofolate deformylase|nr:formyltetrahydrofolate deformylase [Acidimicrobiaceae bacterium]|tara:strand:+ start:1894 stop:2742 length:849 start_codon:yes stop_codon:yes gene_type:complete